MQCSNSYKKNQNDVREEEVVIDRSLALAPMPLRMEEVSATGLIAKSDIDSLMICARLEPFRCRYIAKMCTKPAKITACQNVKLTRYLTKKASFRLRRLPEFTHGFREIASATDKWFECAIGSMDDRRLWLLFQLDAGSVFFVENAPLGNCIEGDRQESRLRAACSAFMMHMVTCAAREMPVETETAGFRYLQYDVDRTYNVMQTDFASFARNVSFFLEDTNLSTMCDLQFVRFYVSSHGMRLPKRRAEALLREIADVDHAHMDVL